MNHEAKRRTVATGVLAGHRTKDIARAASTTPRNVQRIAAEPETHLLITAALRPHRKRLEGLAKRAIYVVQTAMLAKTTDKADHATRLKAVERYGELLNLAQGKVLEIPVDPKPQYTWEEFTVLYQSRQLVKTEFAHPETTG